MSEPFTLIVPADARYRGLAPDVAVKYAELAGGTAADGKALAATLSAAMDRLAADAAADAEIDLTFRPEAGGVAIELRCNGQSQTIRASLQHPHPR